MGLDGLLPYLKPRLTRNPNKPVILVPDRDAPYRRVVEVYDTLLQAGTANISFPTSSEIESYVNTFGSFKAWFIECKNGRMVRQIVVAL